MTHAHDRTLLAKLGFDDPDRRNPLHDAACQYLARPEIAWKVRDHVFPLIKLPHQVARKTIHFSTPYCSDMEEHHDMSIVENNPISVHSDVETHVQKGEGKYSTTIGFIDVVSVFTRERLYVGTRTPRRIMVNSVEFVAGSVEHMQCVDAAPSEGSFVCLYDPVDEGKPLYSEWTILSHDDVSISCKRSKYSAIWTPDHPRLAPITNENELRTFPIVGSTIRVGGYWKDGETVPFEYKEQYTRKIAIEVKAHPSTAGDVLRQIALYRSYFIADKWIVATCYPVTKRDADAFTSAGVEHVQLSPDRVKAWAREQDAGAYEAHEV